MCLKDHTYIDSALFIFIYVISLKWYLSNSKREFCLDRYTISKSHWINNQDQYSRFRYYTLVSDPRPNNALQNIEIWLLTKSEEVESKKDCFINKHDYQMNYMQALKTVLIDWGRSYDLDSCAIRDLWSISSETRQLDEINIET